MQMTMKNFEEQKREEEKEGDEEGKNSESDD